MKTKITLLVCFFFLLSACSVSLRDQKPKEDYPKSNTALQEISDSKQSDDCRYLCTLSWSFLEIEPGSYNLKIQWRNHDESDGKIRFYLDSEVIGFEDIKKENYVISQIESNEIKNFQFEWISQKDGLIDFREQIITGPSELIIKDNLRLQSDLVFTGERVYFYKNARLITNGFKVQIQSEKLQADQAEILTFEQGSKATQGQNGRSGGEINIIVGEASGNLQVSMRGQHGGDGIQGEPWGFAAANGQVGDQGESEYNSCIKPLVSSSKDERSICRSYSYCIRDSTASSPGANGLPGRPGSNGLSGGSSGVFDMKILSINKMDIKVNTQVGLGGSGGPGGLGQMGGVGGPEIKGATRCRNHPAASNGAQGPDGPSGQTGVSGDKQSACISYDNSQFCY
jgi:hypothetical protein